MIQGLLSSQIQTFSLPVLEVNGVNPFEPQKDGHVYRLLAGVLSHFWRSQSGISVRNGSIGIGVDLVDRSILCRLSIFAGVVRAPIATQPGRTGVPDLAYSPLPLLDGGEFLSEVDWDDFLWAVPKKRTSHSKKRMRMTHKYLKPIQHYTTCPKC